MLQAYSMSGQSVHWIPNFAYYKLAFFLEYFGGQNLVLGSTLEKVLSNLCKNKFYYVGFSLDQEFDKSFLLAITCTLFDIIKQFS